MKIFGFFILSLISLVSLQSANIQACGKDIDYDQSPYMGVDNCHFCQRNIKDLVAEEMRKAKETAEKNAKKAESSDPKSKESDSSSSKSTEDVSAICARIAKTIRCNHTRCSGRNWVGI